MNLIALGVEPLAMPEQGPYGRLVVEPAVPRSTAELGLRAEPNLELLKALQPDLLVGGDDLAMVRDRLQAIAPLIHFTAHDTSGARDQLAHGSAALGKLADAIGLHDSFDRYLSQTEAEIAQAAERLRGHDRRPLFTVSLLDIRRVLLFGRTSLFQSVLDRLQIDNAWQHPVSDFGHATLTIDRLLERSDARILFVGGIDPDMAAAATPVIASLPFFRQRRFAAIPEVLFYGGLPCARRFARLAGQALIASRP